jgi:hypothetical protein
MLGSKEDCYNKGAMQIKVDKGLGPSRGVARAARHILHILSTPVNKGALGGRNSTDLLYDLYMYIWD